MVSKNSPDTNEPNDYESEWEQCPYCGGDVYFVGFDDGGGDYGDSVCEIYECDGCGFSWERHCVDDGDVAG